MERIYLDMVLFFVGFAIVILATKIVYTKLFSSAKGNEGDWMIIKVLIILFLICASIIGVVEILKDFFYESKNKKYK